MPEEPKQPEAAAPATPSDPSASISPESPQAVTSPVTQSGQVVAPSSTPENQTVSPQPAAQPPVSAPTETPSLQQPAVTPSVIGTVPQAQLDSADSQPQIGTSQPPVVGHVGKPKRGKLYIAAAAVVLVLLLAGGYVFAFYLPNTPSHVFESGLANSGLALDKLINYSKTQQQADYNSVSTSGSLQVKSPSGSYDMTASGSADKHGNATATLRADILGENVTANIRSIVSKGSSTPDLYVQVNGIKSLLDSLGASSLDKYNGQWIVIDHTLIDTYTSALKSDLSSNAAANASQVPTYAEVQDAISKVQAVNKQYLFTTNSSKAVLTNQKYLGQQTANGHTQDEFQVGYIKAHLETYVSTVSSALDSSQLNSWSKLANKGQSLSQVMDFSSLTKSVQNAKSDYAFYMWVDKNSKLISKVQFSDTSDGSVKFTLSQSYTGGDIYPFSFNVAGKDSQGESQNTTIGLNLNTTTNKVAVNFSSSSTSSSGTTTASGDFSVTPSKNFVQVTAPSGAKSLSNILLGFDGGLFSPTTGTVNQTLSNGISVNYSGPLLPVNSQ